MVNQITTIQMFKSIKNNSDFLVVITDTTGNKIHNSRCHHVDIAHFRTKVILKQESGEKPNGTYNYSENMIELLETFKPKKCDDCKKRGLF